MLLAHDFLLQAVITRAAGCCSTQVPFWLRLLLWEGRCYRGQPQPGSWRCSPPARPGGWVPTIEGSHSHAAQGTRAAGLTATPPVGICTGSTSAHGHTAQGKGQEGPTVESVLRERWAWLQRCLLLGNEPGVLLLPQGIGFGDLGGLHGTDSRGRPGRKQVGRDGAGPAPGRLALSSSLRGG